MQGSVSQEGGEGGGEPGKGQLDVMMLWRRWRRVIFLVMITITGPFQCHADYMLPCQEAREVAMAATQS